MSTQQTVFYCGRCLRAAAPPLLVLAALTLVRTAHAELPTSAGAGEFVLMTWRAAVIAALLWLLLAVALAATRPSRDRRAFDRLWRLREMGAAPDRTLVHVQTTVWSSTAGQMVVVVNVATGVTSRIWLSETTVAIGAFVVLERTNGGACVLEGMNAHQVEAGHRHEQRHAAHRPSSVEPRVQLLEQGDREAALQLIEETERFLKEQEPHW